MEMFISLMEAVILAFVCGAIVGAIVAMHLRAAGESRAVERVDSNQT